MHIRFALLLALPELALLGCSTTVQSSSPPADAATEDRASVAADVPIVDTPTVDTPIVDIPAVDVPAPQGPCEGAVSLAAGAVDLARVERVPDGLVVAWASREGSAVMVQSLTESLAPRSPALSLPLPTRGTESLSLSFNGTSGVVAASSSLYFLSLDANSVLTMRSRLDAPGRTLRWARALGDSAYRALTADGGFIFTTGARLSINEPNAPLSPPHGAEVSVVIDDIGGGYTAFEPRDMNGARRLHARSFIFGHGASIEVRSTWLDEASASPVVEAGASLYRLVHRGVREVDVALEERSATDLSLRAPARALQAQAAWISTTGAISARDPQRFMAWASKPMLGGYNSAITVMWDGDRAPTEVHQDARDRRLHVFGAETSVTAPRGWVLFGEPDPMGGYALLGRCVIRMR